MSVGFGDEPAFHPRNWNDRNAATAVIDGTASDDRSPSP